MEELKEVLKICQLGDCTGCEMHDHAHCRDIVMRDSLNVIEALEAELSRYTENCKYTVEQAKTEVAREIFAEVESCIFEYGSNHIFSHDKFDELKKKYIGEISIVRDLAEETVDRDITNKQNKE